MSRFRRVHALLVIGLGLWSFADAAPAKESFRASFVSRERRIEISADGLGEGDFELRIETDGLKMIETGTDVNEPGALYLPSPESPPPAAENVFFFNDLVSAEGWELVIRFEPPATGTWKLNGRFSARGGELRSELAIPVGELEVGENLLHFSSEPLRPPTFYFRRAIQAGARFSCGLTVDGADWAGHVSLLRSSGSSIGVTLADTSLAGPTSVQRPTAVSTRWWEDRNALNDSVLAIGRNILAAQVQRSGSLFNGGFNLVYDTEHKVHRMPHWIWAWGPSIKLLLDLEKLEIAKAAGLAPRFREAALAAGKRSLDFGVTDSRHPAFGVSTVRWEPSRATPLGWAEYISTADSLFMAGWGWMSLYRETHESVYLERTTALVAAAGRLMQQYPVIPQDWIVERSRWTPHTLDESVFGTIAFRRLFETTHQGEIAAAGKRFLDSHREHMGRESGLLARAWLRDENKGVWDPDIKGHAWVIEGYLDAYRLSHDASYLELARALADRVISCQADDGSWTYLFKKPEPGDPIDDKGTAIWAYLFYDLFKITKSPGDLAAARRALGWCLRHQYRGDNPHLDGAILHSNAMAYVHRRPMTILYTTTFFGLAILEELALSAGVAQE